MAPLQIRREQVEALRADQIDTFAEAILPYFNAAFSRQLDALDGAARERWIRVGVVSALSFGLLSRQDVMKYVELAVFLGWVDGAPEHDDIARTILEREDLDAPSKLDALDELNLHAAGSSPTGGR